jgi:tRNA-splicing ligase RtcB
MRNAKCSRGHAKRQAKGLQVFKELEARGVIVMAAGAATVAEEMPEAYKDVAAVVNVVHEAGIARRVAQLRPIGVIKG